MKNFLGCGYHAKYHDADLILEPENEESNEEPSSQQRKIDIDAEGCDLQIYYYQLCE